MRPLDCHLAILSALLIGSIRPEVATTPCPSSLSIPLLDPDIQRFENGTILHKNHLYAPNSYWYDGNETRGCVCQSNPPCVRKCCSPGHVVGDGEAHPCIAVENLTIPDLSLHLERISQKDNESRVDFSLPVSRSCPDFYMAYALTPEFFPEDAYVLHENGTLELPLMKDVVVYPQWQYCMDWRENMEDLAILVCLPTEEAELVEASERIVFTVGVFLSVPFLAMTFFVYAVVPELRNIYGKTLMCYVAALISAYSSMFVSKQLHYGTGCVVTGEILGSCLDFIAIIILIQIHIRAIKIVQLFIHN